jgi:MtN3 and saliva related transmembrane protein
VDLSPAAVTLIGSVAAVLTTVAFLPQLLRVWKLKRADEISFATYVVFSVGMVIWLLYGVLVGSWPIILANAITLAIAISILALKVRWDRIPSAEPP